MHKVGDRHSPRLVRTKQPLQLGKITGTNLHRRSLPVHLFFSLFYRDVEIELEKLEKLEKCRDTCIPRL